MLIQTSIYLSILKIIASSFQKMLLSGCTLQTHHTFDFDLYSHRVPFVILYILKYSAVPLKHCLGSIEMGHVISKMCYKETILQRNYRMLYQNMCYKKVYYKETILYQYLRGWSCTHLSRSSITGFISFSHSSS